MKFKKLTSASSKLRDKCDELASELILENIIDYVYNPLNYAWDVHKEYLKIASKGNPKCILLGMNPGPHGMGQMGIPFAASSIVRDLFEITGIKVMQPSTLHPARPVLGLEYPRDEISGIRIWNLLSGLYGTRDSIFNNVFVVNHCPLMLFNGQRATNITPDKIRGMAVEKLLKACDEHLIEVTKIFEADTVVGIGKYAEKRAKSVFQDTQISVKGCWHPSTASPLANRNNGKDWQKNITAVLPTNN